MKTRHFGGMVWVAFCLVISLGIGIYFFSDSLTQKMTIYFNQISRQNLFFLFLALGCVAVVGFGVILAYFSRQNKRTQETLYKIAYVDPITLGPTWAKAKQDIRQILLKYPQEQFAFIIFDVNKFKVLNERLGYLQANEVLRHVGLALRENMQEKEMFCRVQADVFQLLLRYQTPEQLKNRLEILNEQIIISCPIEKNAFQMILSFGVYFITQPARTINDLLVKAALARDSIKGKYDDIIGFYNENLEKKFQLEQEIENHMEDALSQEQFRLHLAPIRAMDGTLYAAETTLHWQLPSYADIPEAVFKKVFTKNGFIHRLDLYTVEKVCQFQRRRLQEKQDLFPIFVNLSSDSLQSPLFASSLVRLVKKYQLDSNALVLQAAPQNEIPDTGIIRQIAHRLYDEGFVLSLDQAGKGYGSLELLKILPLQVIKIEPETVADLEENERARRLADSMIYMSQQLKVKIIFSGVNNLKQRQILKNLGADFIMGPVNGAEVSLPDSDLLLGKSDR